MFKWGGVKSLLPHVMPAKVKQIPFLLPTTVVHFDCGEQQMRAESGGNCCAFHSWPHTVTVYIQTDTAEAAGQRLYQQLKCFPPHWFFSLRLLFHVAGKLYSPQCCHQQHLPTQSLDSGKLLFSLFCPYKTSIDVSAAD